MITFTGKNITEIFYNALNEINSTGHTWQTIKCKVKEITPVVMNIKNPKERCLVVPYRYSNIISTIIQTIWVLAGMNEIEVLKKYLPRVTNWSDDSKTWSGAYGYRLFNYHGINQVKNVIKELKHNKYSRRTVLVIGDPQKDFHNTKDVPCSSWIQIAITNENKLNLYVVYRANDLIWGFTGINFFEWTVFQELISYWLDVDVGEYYQFVGSLNLFQRHFKRTEKLLKHRIKEDIYSKYKNIKIIPVDIAENEYEKELNTFFEIERDIWTKQKSELINNKIMTLNSNFLIHCIQLIQCVYYQKTMQYKKFVDIFNILEESDLKIAAAEYFLRQIKTDNIARQLLMKTFTLW